MNLLAFFSFGSAWSDLLRRGYKLVFTVFFVLFDSFSKTKIVLGLLETRGSHQMSLGPVWPSHKFFLDTGTPFVRYAIYFRPDRFVQLFILLLYFIFPILNRSCNILVYCEVREKKELISISISNCLTETTNSFSLTIQIVIFNYEPWLVSCFYFTVRNIRS